MKLSRASSRYAKAILSLAIDENKALAVNEDMKNILVTISNNKELRNFLSSPLVKEEQKRGGLRQIFKDAGDVTMKTFDLLVDNKRTDILLDVATSYIVLFEDMNKREIATVTTAVAISADLEMKVLARAKELAGKEVTLEKIVDPSILGGFVLRVGDKEINASVNNKLGELKRTFASN
ncbi:F-type H+-transporting ATPase subunit delta [Nonlabens dokdonensis]|jgi:F-type H+-transporting ATPase subunit delta|uniref:ATP synthase subunit delta n=2 Tax=Nonlabens dokdonensis TaxID=328515 RepID=L7WC51_NONDD|nr:ATP synthase F1 subunit delta [Nonlabens dokdonensis]AGC76473.1 ATP synthase delta chain [Nonlabens dokdonensis DSW-6]PZX44128.1 F-type H+-transporting ATPase subunit delta [Nonlabens dokdonensis]